MICHVCDAAKLPFKVTETRQSRTLMSEQVFEKDGEQHIHDPNKWVIEYRCSNGHTWVLIGHITCPTCADPWRRSRQKEELFFRFARDGWNYTSDKYTSWDAANDAAKEKYPDGKYTIGRTR